MNSNPPTGNRELLELARSFRGLTLTVWGDLVADEFVAGEIARVSREAPVLILKRRSRVVTAGGGANAALNLASLGVEVRLVGAVGRDEAGDQLLRLFAKHKMDTRRVLRPAGYTTPVKTRILAHHAHTRPQQVVRMDYEPAPLPETLARRLAVAAASAMRGAQALLVSDYGYGAATPSAAAAARRALGRNAVITVDSRFRIGEYRDVTAATPNEAEVEAASGRGFAGDAGQLAAAASRMRIRMKCARLLVTRGRDGMALFEAGARPLWLPVYGSQEALDVTGAGDTVIAVFTAALAAGAVGGQAARLANVCGGLVVMKHGTAAVTRAQLEAALRGEG